MASSRRGGSKSAVSKSGSAYKNRGSSTSYTPHQDLNAGNGTYNSSGAWTDNEMLSAADRDKIAGIRDQLKAGSISGDEANNQANAIRAGYGYSIDKRGYVTDNGALTAVNNRREQAGMDKIPEGGSGAYYRYLMDTDTSRGAQESGQVKSYEDFARENGYGTPSAGVGTVGSGTAGTSTAVSSGRTYDIGDGNDYLKQLYANQMKAELAALKSAYEKNTATLDESADKIPLVYDISRNQTASQNALSRSRFLETAAANGLNTGTTGQAALAQDIAYQQALAEINRQQGDKLADLELQKTQLATEYENAIAQAEATGNADLAKALYEEYVRQQNLAATQAANEAKLQAQASAQKPTLSASAVQSALKNGIVTADVISAFDYYYGDGAYDALYGSGKLTAGGSSGSGSTGGKKGSYSNGSLIPSQVKELQKYYNVTADGKWGTNSKKAAGGMTADEAWEAYQGSGGGSSKSQTNSAGTTVTPTNYEQMVKASESGEYGPKYGSVLRMIQARFGSGADLLTLADMIDSARKNGDISEAGAKSILSAFGM